jgi:hypothetical protein
VESAADVAVDVGAGQAVVLQQVPGQRGKLAGSRRMIAFMGDTDDLVTGADGEEQLRWRWAAATRSAPCVTATTRS